MTLIIGYDQMSCPNKVNADPYRYGALALYNVCDADTANMFDTGKGHTIPRTGKVISELGDAVRELISSTEE
jgi:hypothetical protein